MNTKGISKKFFERGDFTRAFDAASEGLSNEPEDSSLLQVFASAARELGRYDEAISASLALLRQFPSEPSIKRVLMLLVAEASITDKTREVIAALISAGEPSYQRWLDAGAALKNGHFFLSAHRCAEQASKLQPAKAGGWALAAATHQAAGSIERALSACEEGLKANSASHFLTYCRAQLLRQKGDFTQATGAYLQAQRAGVSMADLPINLAESFLESGRPLNALEVLIEATEKEVENLDAHRFLATLHVELDLEGDPLAYLQRACRKKPESLSLHYQYAELLVRQQRFDEMLEFADAASKRAWFTDPGFSTLKARALSGLGQVDRATQLFEALRDQQGSAPVGLLDYAQHALMHQMPELVEELTSEQLQFEPTNQLAWCFRGTGWQLMADERAEWLFDYDLMPIKISLSPPNGYGNSGDFFRELTTEIAGHHHVKTAPINQSVRFGTQSKGFLFAHNSELLTACKAMITEGVVEAFNRPKRDAKHPFWSRFATPFRRDSFLWAGAWSVRLSDQGHHAHHIHDRGWISSAMHVSLPDFNQDSNPKAGQLCFGQPMAELNLPLKPRKWCAPEPGTLLLFPSYMWHGTEPFRAPGFRTTIAFDLLPASTPRALTG